MNMKTFRERNMQDALHRIREELGEDAVIISTKQDSKGVQVVAAADYELVSNGDSDNYEIYKSNDGANIDPNKFTEDVSTYNENTAIKNEERDTRVKDEIIQLRKLIESQTEMISWNRIINKNSMSRKILQKLSVSGFGFNLSKDLLIQVRTIPDFDSAWKIVEKEITRSISILEKNIIDTGGVVALLGPTGVGKTTTIAKIAAQFALKHSNEQVALISTDHYRIGAHDQISIYASILNVPVIAAANKKQLRRALNEVSDKQLIVIDTPGLSQKDSRISKIVEILSESTNKIDKYLVLSAASQLCVQNEIIHRFSPEKLDGVIISKTDEASQIGGVLTVLMERSLPIAFETTGQRVPEDINRPDSKSLFNTAINLGREIREIESIHSTELFSELVDNV